MLAAHVDSTPADPPALVAPAATDLAPHAGRERQLCEKASTPDWLYSAALLVLDAAAIWFDNDIKLQDQPGVRLLGPSAVGLAWGATIGGGYLALPKCDMRWVSQASYEGDIRTSWPLAISLAMLAGATAPVVVGVESGPLGGEWQTSERVMRLVLAGTTGFVGALLPYVVAPKTWRAAKELEKLRLGASATGATVGFSFAF